MARKLQSDKWLFLATLALICASVVMVYSASALVALERFQQPYLFVTRQMMWAAVGIAVLSIVMRIDYRAYRNDKMIWLLLGVVSLMLIAVLFSRPINGTRRWFGVGGFGIQPSELAKMAAILFTALVLERRRTRINELQYSLLPIALIVGGLVTLILLEPDFVRRRYRLPLSSRRRPARAAGAVRDPDAGRLSPSPPPHVHGSVG
jgi:cell division protein FtsW